MAEVSWPELLLIGRIQWQPSYVMVRQMSAWSGATREVEIGPAGRWRAVVAVHQNAPVDVARLQWLQFDALLRQPGGWTRVPGAAFPQYAPQPALQLQAPASAGARQAAVTSTISSTALARAGQRITLRSADGGHFQMLSLTADLDVDANGHALAKWAEPLRFDTDSWIEARLPFAPMRYAAAPKFTELPGQFIDIEALQMEESF